MSYLLIKQMEFVKFQRICLEKNSVRYFWNSIWDMLKTTKVGVIRKGKYVELIKRQQENY